MRNISVSPPWSLESDQDLVPQSHDTKDGASLRDAAERWLGQFFKYSSAVSSGGMSSDDPCIATASRGPLGGVVFQIIHCRRSLQRGHMVQIRALKKGPFKGFVLLKIVSWPRNIELTASSACRELVSYSAQPQCQHTPICPFVVLILVASSFQHVGSMSLVSRPSTGMGRHSSTTRSLTMIARMARTARMASESCPVLFLWSFF